MSTAKGLRPVPGLDQPAEDRPCAAEGWVSYRYRGSFGWIGIGARNVDEALREAKRSVTRDAISVDRLEVWDGTGYVPAASDR